MRVSAAEANAEGEWSTGLAVEGSAILFPPHYQLVAIVDMADKVISLASKLSTIVRCVLVGTQLGSCQVLDRAQWLTTSIAWFQSRVDSKSLNLAVSRAPASPEKGMVLSRLKYWTMNIALEGSPQRLRSLPYCGNFQVRCERVDCLRPCRCCMLFQAFPLECSPYLNV